jgi:beta-fructofuranosidase
VTVSAREPAELARTGRPRPRIHFTATEGWINDPYGITWLGDRYRMFYQAMPERTTWGEACAWGTAESPDLVRWHELPLALEPQPFEVGCWSGTALLHAVPPRLFYTRIASANWAHGAIATATGDAALTTWSTGVDDVVIAGPPSELGVTTLRDSFVFRHGAEWVMIVGAGLSDGSGAAVQYRSPDLVSWTCDGLLASRASDASGLATGQVWECPQFFPLGDVWVLLVSVWDEDELYYVAAAIGDYDGRRFAPRSWQRLTYGSSAYATTAFEDKDGRRCVLSWLREEPRNDPDRVGWVGAHSLAALVTLDADGRLVLAPHPDVTALGTQTPHPAEVDGSLRVLMESGAAQLTLQPTPGTGLSITADTGELARIDFADDFLTMSRPMLPAARMPVDASQPLAVYVDADIVEVVGPAGYGAFRIGAATDAATTELVFPSRKPELSVRTF